MRDWLSLKKWNNIEKQWYAVNSFDTHKIDGIFSIHHNIREYNLNHSQDPPVNGVTGAGRPRTIKRYRLSVSPLKEKQA